MRFARFEYAGTIRFGSLEADAVRPFSAGVTSLQTYLAVPERERATLPAEAPVPLRSVRLLAPVRSEKNVFCVGRNYMGHAEEVARARNIPLNLPAVPTFFTKAPTSISNPDDVLHLPPELSEQYDYEAELAAVIGTRCRDVSAEEALSVVFGYTCLNDVTARDIQKAHHQWFKGKSLDETCPIGPWLVSADEIGDPDALDIALRVDGATKQSSNTGQMIFSVAAIIASLSAGLTLEPGDIIATGTPDGVGFARTPPEFLHDGAVMEVEIAKIGTLRNTVALRRPAVPAQPALHALR